MRMNFISPPFQDKRRAAQCIFISPSLCWTGFFMRWSGRRAISWHSVSMRALCLWASAESPGPASAQGETTSIHAREKANDMGWAGESPVLCWCLWVFEQTCFARPTMAWWRPGLAAAGARRSHDHLIKACGEHAMACLISKRRSNCKMQRENGGVCIFLQERGDPCRTGTDPARHNVKRKLIPVGGCVGSKHSIYTSASASKSGWLFTIINLPLKLTFTDFPHSSSLCTLFAIHKAASLWSHSGRTFGLDQSQCPIQFASLPKDPIYSLVHP